MQINALNTTLKPEEVFWQLKDEKHCIFLDSGMDHEHLGRYSIIAWEPFLTFESKGKTIRIQDEKSLIEYSGNTFEALKKLYSQYASDIITDLPFVGGFMGYFGYDLCHQIEKLPTHTIDDIGLPDCFMGLYDGAYVYDHKTNLSYIADSGIREGMRERVLSRIEWLENMAKPSIELPKMEKSPVFKSNFEKEDYIKALSRLKAYIRTGDIYQANLTQRFTTEMTQSPAALYMKLRQVNPAPFAAFIPLERGAVISSSPERLLKIDKNIIETRPIKGTRPRGRSPEEDALLKEELIASEKDRSELLMIVDLERNDLSKVSKTGTVKVPELMVCETYPTVFHLVSTVRGELKEGLDPLDVIMATFPGGSITGAPKIRAMEVIDELEPTQRSVYTGGIGYIGFNGQTDFNIAIRTIICHHDQASFQAGGGIVWDSDEESEYQETLDKAKAMMNALSL